VRRQTVPGRSRLEELNEWAIRSNTTVLRSNVSINAKLKRSTYDCTTSH